MFEFIGFRIAKFLQKASPGYKPLTHTDPARLRKTIKPGDILLVEGNLRISIAIKYLTQSTWSHAAVYVGPENPDDLDSPCLIEADVAHGVIKVPLSKYAGLSTRICRPVNLREEDREKLIQYLNSKIGMKYDMSNTMDLARYLFPMPPVPVKWRRKMLAMGSGEPTKAICSTLIAQAFQYIKYPVLPKVSEQVVLDPQTGEDIREEILHIRHYSLFTPRDFDISPYFQVIKPTIETGFDYKKINWGDADPSKNI